MTFNSNNFIIMNRSRLFTAKDVCDIVRDELKAEREKIYALIKAERDPSLEYVDWDSVEAVFIRLRDGVK